MRVFSNISYDSKFFFKNGRIDSSNNVTSAFREKYMSDGGNLFFTNMVDLDYSSENNETNPQSITDLFMLPGKQVVDRVDNVISRKNLALDKKLNYIPQIVKSETTNLATFVPSDFLGDELKSGSFILINPVFRFSLENTKYKTPLELMCHEGIILASAFKEEDLSQYSQIKSKYLN